MGSPVPTSTLAASLIFSQTVMHSFICRVGMVGSNSEETVEKVRDVLKEILESDFENSNKLLKERLDKHLVNIFGSEALFYLWVDAMWRSSAPEKKSFFINIMVKGKRHIIITAEYKELKTLRDIAAKMASKSFNEEKEIEKLRGEIPSCLFDDIKQFL